MAKTRKLQVLPFILITSLFLVWGLFNNLTDTFREPDPVPLNLDYRR